MKRKIFSITLAILMILSTLGGLTAFAETTVTDVSSDAATTIGANTYSASTGTVKWWNSDQMLQLSSGATVTYDLNVAAEGNYGITLNVKNPKGYNGSYQVFIGDNTAYESQLYIGKINTIADGQLGVIKLSAGNQKLKIKLSGGSGALQSITLDPTKTVVSAEAPTTIRASYSANINATKWWGNDGFMEMRQSNYVTYDINVLDESGYNIKLNLSNPAGMPGAFNVYVGDVQQTQLSTKTINSDELSNLGVIHLPVGTHKLKIEGKSGAAYLKSITLEACIEDISPDATTTINAYCYTTQTGATWNNNDKFLEMTQSDTVVYTVNVLYGGAYNLTVDLQSVTDICPYFYVYVDTTDTKIFTSGKIDSAEKSKLGELFLTKGEHKIIISSYSGTGWLKSITLASDTAVADVSSETATTIAANECSDTSGTKWYYGDKFLEVTQSDTVAYTVNVIDAGDYVLTVNLRSVSSISPYFNVYLDTVKQTDLTSGKIDSAEKSKLGSIFLTQGTHTIKIENYSGTGWLNSITLEADVKEPTVTLYEGGLDSTTEATGITDGTMSVKVDLNGSTAEGKDVLVIFAVYESDGTEFTRLHGSVVIPVAAANLAETAQGSITGISQVSGYNYTAKVFIWDATTITGDVISFFN